MLGNKSAKFFLAILFWMVGNTVFGNSIVSNSVPGSSITYDGVSIVGNGRLLDVVNGKVLFSVGTGIMLWNKSTGTTKTLANIPCSNTENGTIIDPNTERVIVACNGALQIMGGVQSTIPGIGPVVGIKYIGNDLFVVHVPSLPTSKVSKLSITQTGATGLLDLYSETNLRGLGVGTKWKIIHKYNSSNSLPRKTESFSNFTSFGTGAFQMISGSDNLSGKAILNLSNGTTITAYEYDIESGTLIRNLGTAWKTLYDVGNQPTPTPTPNPVLNSVINGMICEELEIPDPQSAVWNTDFGKLPLYSTSSGTEANGERWIQTTSVSNDMRSFDTVRLQNIGDGSELPIGSIGYPGNGYANININNSADTSITVQSKRDGALAKWNLLQFHGVNQQGFQSWSASSVVRVGGQYLEGQGLSATGGIATLAVAGRNLADTASIFTPVSGFSGIRIGYATPTKKKYCSAQSNKCEWSYEGGSLLCQGVPTPDGLVSGSCGIAGSGSIYGSGSCVPLTNASGSVVEVDLPGSYTIVQNPDGTTTKVKAGTVGQAGSIFACKITGETWYERIGQYIACPFTQILPNLWNYMTSPIKDLSKGATSVSTSGSGGIGLVGTGAEQSNNQVILSIKNAIETWTGDNQHPINRYVFLVVALVAILLIVAMVALVVSVIKE